ncbi:hypothetical protein R6Q59_010098 [Mikania micrantha]
MMVEALPVELMGLPAEILLTVIQLLDFESLLRAVYVNKHFRELAEPLVYESITVLHDQKARNLSQALAKDRRRPAWVRSLLVSTKFGEEHDLMKLPPAICHMSNLEELRLETPDCNRKKPEERTFWIELQDHYERILRQSSVLIADNRDRLLPNLKSCVIHFVDTHTELYSLSRYASIFLHPRLESLTISCMSTDFPDTLFSRIESIDKFYRSTNLEYLHLEECDVHPPSLEILLSFPRALKSLTISEGIRYDGFFRAGSSRLHGNAKPQPLGQVLVGTCKESLESLSLALGYVRPLEHDINDASHYLKLNELQKLKHLEVSYQTLNLLHSRPECDHGTSKRWPPSLETLKISSVPLLPAQQDSRQAYVPLESCMVKDKKLHGVSNLKTIIYSYEHQVSIDEDDINFNNFLMTLVHNRTNDNPPDGTAVTPVLNVIQQAVNAALNPPQPTNPALTIAAINPNINFLPHIFQPPQFRWRTNSHLNRQNLHPGLSRSDNAKIALLETLHDSILSDFVNAQICLQVDLVTLPREYIPPYLFPEDKPTIQEAWFSSTAPLTPAAFMRSIREQREAPRHSYCGVIAAPSRMSNEEEEEVYETERARSLGRFLRRMRPTPPDPSPGIWPPVHYARVQDDSLEDTTTVDAHDDNNDDDDDDDDDDEMDPDFTVTGNSADGDMDSDSSGINADESAYVDAGTDVEMSEVEADSEDEGITIAEVTGSNNLEWNFGSRGGAG